MHMHAKSLRGFSAGLKICVPDADLRRVLSLRSSILRPVCTSATHSSERGRQAARSNLVLNQHQRDVSSASADLCASFCCGWLDATLLPADFSFICS